MSTTALERNAEKLYQALRALGPGWHGRHAIADHLGKSRLTGHDVAAMDLLVLQGRVVAERHDLPPPTPIDRRWEYKIAEQEATHEQKATVVRVH